MPLPQETLDLLIELSERCDRPPWIAMVEGRDHDSGDSFIQVGEDADRGEDMYVTRDSGPASAAYLDMIALARTCLPSLIAEVRATRHEMGRRPNEAPLRDGPHVHEEPAHVGQMFAAFEVAAEHGCLVVRDIESDGDTSDWDPSSQAWLADRGSAIFSVLPGTEGIVRCEVWDEAAGDELEHELFTDDFVISGALVVGDPAGRVTIELPMVRGERTIRVLVDDPSWPTHVQVVVMVRRSKERLS